MKHYYIFGLILLFILTFSTKSFAYDFTVNGLYYNLDTSDGTIYVTFGDEQYSGEVVVPSNVIYKDRNLKVSKIGSYAFSNNKDLISVTIENGIETIDNNAFELCDNLETITIPLSVTEINPYAFQGCKRLLSITIPKGLTRLSEGLFQNCDKLKEIEIPNNIEEIDNYCFKNCKSIKQIKIPGSVKKIGDFLGYKTNFTNGGGYSIAFKGEVFRGCDNLINIEIQEGVEIIGHATFQGCKKIETIDLPNSITYIGKLAFSHCTSLKTVSISNNLSWLDRNTFDGDEAIKTVIYKDRKDWNFKYINWIFEDRLPNLFEHAYNVGYGGFANSHPTKLYLGRLFSDVIDSCLNLDSLEVMTIGKGCLNSDIGSSMHHSFEKASHLVYIYSMSINT